MNAFDPLEWNKMPGDNGDVIIGFYPNDYLPAIALSEDRLWGAVPSEIILGRVMYLRSVLGGTLEQRDACPTGDYVISKIQAKRDRGRFIVSADFVAKANIPQDLPHWATNKEAAPPAFSIIFDDRQKNDVLFNVFSTDEMIIDEYQSRTVPSIGSHRRLYPVEKPRNGRKPDKARWHMISGVRLIESAGIVCEAKSPKNAWSSTHNLFRNPNFKSGHSL